MRLSPHFELIEFIQSPTGARMRIDNTPAPLHIENLRKLSLTVLEPIRTKLGRPIIVTSGYRCPRLNAAVGGASSSAHLKGAAADIIVPGLSADQLFEQIRRLDLVVDQVINEYHQWVHVGIATDRPPRRQYFLIT